MAQRGRKSAAHRAAMAAYPDPPSLEPPAPPPDPPAPPPHLEQIEIALWDSMFREYQLEGIYAELMMTAAMTAHMRARQCGEIIRQEGTVLIGARGQPKVHPLLSAETSAWASYSRALKALKLEP